MARCSVSAIGTLVFGGLAEAWHRAWDPVCGPGDQSLGIDDRQAEHSYCLRGVGEPRGRLLLADDNRLALEPRAEFRREITHRQDFMTADIDRRGRRLAMREAAQRLRRRIALPDEIDVAEADIDRLALKYLGRDVVQPAVAHVDRVVQPEQPAGRFELLRKILEHALAPDAGLRVFAG